jgi:urea transport system ATP-binding protein
LEIGLLGRSEKSGSPIDKIFRLFPVLKEMLHRRGGDLSGGQQQQLAIGRALALTPQLLILDEPTEGIQPNVVSQIGDVLIQLREEGMTILLVEQKLKFARRVADDFTILDRGRTVARGAMDTLSEDLVKQYLVV